jgi:hypothetical protein
MNHTGTGSISVQVHSGPVLGSVVDPGSGALDLDPGFRPGLTFLFFPDPWSDTFFARFSSNPSDSLFSFSKTCSQNRKNQGKGTVGLPVILNPSFYLGSKIRDEKPLGYRYGSKKKKCSDPDPGSGMKHPSSATLVPVQRRFNTHRPTLRFYCGVR